MTDTDECQGCGSSPEDRAKHSPDATALRTCPHCGHGKCCMCDMGGDVECGYCDE